MVSILTLRYAIYISLVLVCGTSVVGELSVYPAPTRVAQIDEFAVPAAPALANTEASGTVRSALTPSPEPTRDGSASIGEPATVPSATIIAAAVGGAIALFSGLLSSRQTQRSQRELFHLQALQSRRAAILPSRQKALEVTWTGLAKILSGDQLSPTERDAYIAATLWLPPELRSPCLEALSSTSDRTVVLRAQQKTMRYLDSLENEL